MFGATSLVLAVSLSMDSFAAALGRGAVQKRPAMSEALRVGFAFGACQLSMASIGWALGFAFAGFVQAVDHWIAFGLLLLIGGSMIRNALAGESDDDAAATRSGWLALLTVAVATSITEDGVLSSAIELVHSDPDLNYRVFEEEGNHTVVAEWQNWGKKLRLPLFIRAGDGTYLPYSQQVSGITAAPPAPRRRLAADAARRPRFLNRRKPGQPDAV